MKNHAPQQLDLFAVAPRAAQPAGRRPKPPPLDEARLQMKLAGARQRVRNLIVLGMSPGVPAEMRDVVHQTEMSTRAEVRVHIRLLEHFRAQQSRARRDGQPP
jgi:hypothetical protein